MKGKKRIFKDCEIKQIVDMWNSGMDHTQIRTILNIDNKYITRILKVNIKDYNPKKGHRCRFWKGGKKTVTRGYIKMKIYNDDPYYCMADCSDYILEHRYIMAKYLNRPLLENEEVHHKDGNRSNNRIENLQLRVGPHGSGQSYKCTECNSSKIEPIEIQDGPEETWLWNLIENKSTKQFEFIKE